MFGRIEALRSHRAAEAWLDQRLDRIRFVVLDTETTGMHPGRDRVIALAGIAVERGRILTPHFNRLVNPRRSIPAEVSLLTGIRDEDVAGMPELSLVLEDFRLFLDDGVLVGHHVHFDLAFLNRQARKGRRERSPHLGRAVLDTAALFRSINPGAPVPTLDQALHHHGIRCLGRHTALGDALATADLLLSLCERLAGEGVVTLHDLYARLARMT